MTDDAPDGDPPGFEKALDQLEKTVAALESGTLDLDGALTKYQLGVKLLGHCHRLLEGAERTVALITAVDADGNPETTPFDATATIERPAATTAERPAAATAERPPTPEPKKRTRSKPVIDDDPPF